MNHIARLLFVSCIGQLACIGHGSAAEPGMKKAVTDQASFVAYVPEGWKSAESLEGGCRILKVSDPTGQYEAALRYGISPVGDNTLALSKVLLAEIASHFPDLQVREGKRTKDWSKSVFDGSYDHPQKGKREFRSWVCVSGDGQFTFTTVEGPQKQLAAKRQTLLTILANVRLTKGAFKFKGPSPAIQPLVARRLEDASASTRIPKDWTLHDLGKTQLIAADPSGSCSFIVGIVDIASPQIGALVPGMLSSEYLPPHKALQFVGGKTGLAMTMKFLEVIPRKDLVQQVSLVYTVGPVQVEEFVYTCTSAKGENVKGYTFAISFGSRLNTNWKFWHMTVTAPETKFGSLAPTLSAMMHSYSIDDTYAADYIIRGMARLRELQQQTAQIVAQNAQEIRSMMQACYDERQRSMDYIDYQRTNYIRGQQDWISTMEGGTIYHTDSWGTLNTDTSEYSGSKAYDYVHFQGDNPKYNEQMTPIDSRQLWERHVR
jgi:hypothetical protein